MELRDLLPAALADDTEILAVSVDDRDGMRRMIERVYGEDEPEPDFVALSDPDHAVIDRYGLFNPDAPPNRPVPHPATYVIDKRGVVRYRFVEVDYRVRPSNEDVLAALAGLEATGPSSR